jgi:hypothetical protein
LSLSSAGATSISIPLTGNVTVNLQPGIVVISQVYGAGGNNGAVLRHDFVELYNPGNAPVSLENWSIQYASATGTFGGANNTATLSGTISSKGYYLIRLATGNASSQLPEIPTPDVVGNIAVAATAFKIALVDSTQLLSGSNPLGNPTIVDFVGANPTANAFEGTGPAPAPSTTTAIFRKLGGEQDTNDNAADFETGPPNPRNSAFDPTGPSLSTNGTLTPFTTTEGAASLAQSFTVNGTNLTEDVSVSAPPSFEVSTSNATGFDSTLTLVPQSGALAAVPVFVRLAASAPVGTSSGNITLSSGPASRAVAVSGTVNATGPGLPVVTGASFNGTVGVPFSQTVSATNGPNGFTASSSLPAGLTLNASTGAITGTPSAAGNLSLTITATNASGSGNASFSFAISKGTPTIATPPTASPIRAGQALSNSTLSGGTATGLGGADLPGNFSFTNPSTVPTESGNQSVSFTPSDSANWNTATTTVAVTVEPGPAISVTPPTLGGFTTTTIEPSASQTVTVNGTNLEGPILATAPAGYEISRDGVTYSLNLTLTPGQTNAPVARAATVIASDNAGESAYADGWASGDNGGSGFAAWQTPGSSGTGGFNGFFVGAANATFSNHSLIYTDGKAFSIYAGGDGAFQDATRPFLAAMQPGDVLTHSLAFSFDNGNKGFNLLNGDAEVFNFNIGGNGYTWTGGNASMTPWPGVRELGVVIDFTITRTPTGFSYSISSAQDSNLSQNGTIAATGIDALKYYISGAGGGDGGNLYFNNLQITSAGPIGGNLTDTTVYVRLAANGTLGAANGNLTLTSTNATAQEVVLSGTVTLPPPVLSVSPASLPAFSTSLDAPSATASFSVNGSHLTANVSVAAPAGFEVSTSNTTGFGPNATLVPQSGGLAAVPVFARLAARGDATTEPLTGNITLTSGNASASVAVSGEVFEFPQGPFIQPGDATASIPLAIFGEPSTPVGPLTVVGSQLAGNLTITAPAGLEIATTADGNFAQTLDLARNLGGDISNFSFFIRTTATAPVGVFGSDVELSSSGAETKTIAISGTVFAKPVLSASTASLPGFTTRTNEGPSAASAFTLNATDLLDDVTLTAPAGFEMATTAGSYSGQLVLPQGNGTLSETILVRLAATQIPANPVGNLTISSPQAQTREIALSGVVRGPATISVTPSSLAPFDAAVGNASTSQTVSVSGTDLHGPIDIAAPQGFEISLDGTNYFPSLRLTSNATSGEPALLAVDSASNYNGNWGNGTNSGFGFSPWEFDVVEGTGFAGAFTGDPAAAGIVGMADPAFGLYANPTGTGAKAEVSRGMPPLEIGDSFSFQWATNWDSGDGGKGFSLFVGEEQELNVNQGNFPGNITFNGQVAIDGDEEYGDQPMTWTFTRTTATNLLVTSTDRKGNPGVDFSANLTISGAPDGFVWYVDAMEAGNERQPYFNTLRLVSSTLFAGDIPDTTVYVRLAASPTEANFNGNLVFLSPLADTREVPLSGRSIPPPTLVASPMHLGGLATKIDDPTAPYKIVRSFIVSGRELVGNLTVTPSPGLELSRFDDRDFSSAPISWPPEDNEVDQTIVYARIATTADSGLFQGNATLSSPAAENVVVSIAGSVLDDSVVFRDPNLADALGTQYDLNFDWTTTGLAPWFVQTSESLDGSALQSGLIVAPYSSSIQSNLVGPGRLTFHWKISALAPNSRLVLLLNGNEVARITGEVAWNERTILIPARETPHTVRFVYYQGSGSLGGSDAAWVDQVSFTPGELAPQISIEYGGAPLALPGGFVPFQVSGLAGSQTRTITIRNTGSAPLVLNGNPSVSGDGFSISSNASKSTLEPQEFVHVGVTSTVGSYPSWSGFLVVPSNDPDRPSLSIPLQGNVTLTALENWRGRKFQSPWNAGIGHNLADPDNDGIPNLLEYAFGFDPWIANPAPPVGFGTQSRAGKRHLSLLLNRSADDLNYIVETSDNLTNWVPVKTYVGTTPDADDPHFVDTNHDLNAPAASRRFLRVKVQER